MPINILMPALSPTMEEGTLAKWLVKEGDQVSSGAVIAEIETDKATMEFEAVDEGTIGKIVVPEGTEGVKVNDLIAVLLEEGESADAIAAPAPAQPKATPASPAPQAAPEAPRNRRQPPVAAPAEAGCTRLCVAAGASDRRREGHRPRFDRGLGPERPDRQGRRRSRAARRSRPQPAAAPADARPAAAAPQAPDVESIKKLYADREFEEIKLDGMRKIDRRAPHRGEADDPALLPAPRHPSRSAARASVSAQRRARGAAA